MAGGTTWPVLLQRLGQFIKRKAREHPELFSDPRTGDIVESPIYQVVSSDVRPLLQSARLVRDEMTAAGVSLPPREMSPLADPPQRALDLLNVLTESLESEVKARESGKVKARESGKRRVPEPCDLPQDPDEYERVFGEAVAFAAAAPTVRTGVAADAVPLASKGRRLPEPPKLGPHDKQAYQLSLLPDWTQQKIADKLNEEHGTHYTQGQVSRMIRRATLHAKLSGLDDLIPKPSKPARSMDPASLELGRRTDGLSRTQRGKRDPDSD